MADISKIKIESDTYDIKDTIARNYNVYSSTEQVVGTWINNKPLYRKTITETVSANTNAEHTLSSYGINNADVVIIDVGMSTAHFGTTSGKEYATVIYYVSSTDRANIYLNWEGKLIIQNQNSRQRVYNISLLYTKTTD